MSLESNEPEQALAAKWWLKWWTKDTLYGSFSAAPLDELGFFLKLCCLSNEMRFPGYIQANETQGLPHTVIAGSLQLSLDEFEGYLNRMIAEGRVEENKHGIIRILKYEFYQAVKGVPTYKREQRKGGRPSQAQRDARDLAAALRVIDKHPELRKLLADPKQAKSAVDKLIQITTEESE